MAHTKSGGSKMHQGLDIKGKRLGLKVSEGEFVKGGEILVRQRGMCYLPGWNTGIGRDYTIYAKRPGKIHFRDAGKKKGRKKIIDVI